MVLVDVYVPVAEKAYDFSLDETARVSALIEEIVETLCQKERWPRQESAGGLLLCDVQGGLILPADSTLAGMGIGSGRRLMLV